MKSENSSSDRILPEGWRLLRLEDVCEKKITLRNPNLNLDESFYYVDISSIDNKLKRIITPKQIIGKDAPSRARQVIKTGDILVSTTRPNLNAVALVPSNLNNQVCSTGFCILRPRNNINSEYIFSFVQSIEFVQALSDIVKGALYPAVTDSQVLSQLIPIPNITEQERISGILKSKMSSINRAHAAAEAQLLAAKALPAAYLREVFENPDARKWPRKKLGEISDLVSGGTPPRGNHEFFAGNIPWVKTLDLNCDIVRQTEECISDEAFKIIRGRVLPVHTVMVAMYGGSGTIGKSGILGIEAVTNQAICSILPNPCIFSSEFIHCYLIFIRPEWMKHSSGNRRDPNINKNTVSQMECPVPSVLVQGNYSALLAESLRIQTAMKVL
jgi:type I restriction enzyme S subunit